MKIRFVLPPLVMLLMASGTAAMAQTYTAYDLQTSDAGTSYNGNQAWTGAIGMDFDVNGAAISVTSLGVFDSGRDGFHHVLTTYLWNRDTHALITSQSFSPSDPGTLNGYHRFKGIGPLQLNTGHYTISSGGFANDGSGVDNNGNEFIGGFVSDTFNTGGGLISMGTTGRYSEAGHPADYPGNTLGSSLWVNGPSFQFGFAPVPEPGTWALLFGSSVAGLGMLRRRRRTGA